MKSATERIVEAQNALARKPKEHHMSKTKVLVLKPRKLNNEHGVAGDYVEGDILTTEAKYAERLVAAGLASYDLPVETVVEPVEDEPEPTETLFTDVKGVTDQVNAALQATGATWETIYKLKLADLTKVPGLGPKTAAKLKEQAALEVEK